jgi:hypothetical protein
MTFQAEGAEFERSVEGTKPDTLVKRSTATLMHIFGPCV